MGLTEREKVFARLDALEISYEVMEHPAVFSIDEMDTLGITAKGEVCKNLFLRDAKGKRHFLVVVPGEKRADLRALEEQIGCTRLSFASSERLQKYLGLSQGEVTPLGVINDETHAVEVVFDRALLGNSCVGVHPNDNTATVWMTFEAVKQVVEQNGNDILYVEL